MDYRQALAAIWDRSDYDRGSISNPFAGDEAARKGLLRTQGILDQLGTDLDRLNIVHVAGSKGKGSTSVFIGGILQASGRRTGLYTSPHLHSYRERIAVNSKPIGEPDFTRLTSDALDATEAFERSSADLGRVTAWELTTAMALEWFSRAECDVAVIEVGMGGTLDATNIVNPAVSVITTLDLEHTAVLGDTLAEIAGNKAGIIKPNRPVVSARQPDEAMAVIRAKAAETHSRLLVAGQNWTIDGNDDEFAVSGPWGTIDDLRVSLPGQHQVENAALAIAAVMMLSGDMPSIGAEAIRHGLVTVTHPGRFERVNPASGQTVILDGAHTPIAAHALAVTLERHFPGIPPVIVIGMLRDKDVERFFAPLLDIADHWIVVPLASPRGLDPDVLRDALVQRGQHVVTAPSAAAAIQQALDNGAPLVVVTGSLSTVAAGRVALDLAANDPAPA